MPSLDDYLESLQLNLRAPDWYSAQNVASLLSIRDEHSEYPGLQILDINRPVLRRYLRPPWDSLAGLHLRVLYLTQGREWVKAFETQSQLVLAFAKEVIRATKDSNWFLPICYRLCSDLRFCAKMADTSDPTANAQRDNLDADKIDSGSSIEEASSCYLEQAAQPMMACYRECVTDNRPNIEDAKKLAVLNLTNQLFRIYFKIGKLNLLKPLIRTISNIKEIERFAVQDRITYKFYVGRKAMFDSDLKTAEENLSWALNYTPLKFRKHRRLILTYLIPVKMFLGHMPTQEMLQKYELMQFSDVARGVRYGDLVALERSLQENEQFFIKCGIFLMLEKLKVIAYRTLFKRVCHIVGSNQVKLDHFLAALRLMEVHDVDSDELACILANLIHQHRIKGYISHKHRTLVVSKVEPFPALATIGALG